MIEILETKDYNLLTEMNEEVQTFHHRLYPAIFKPYDKEKIISFFKMTLEKENTKAWIVREKGITLGYALVFIIESGDNPFQYARKYILLDQISVLSDYRAKGIGKLLLETVFSFAKSSKINTVELNHWTLNHSARHFFNKNGFEYYNEKMWKTIE